MSENMATNKIIKGFLLNENRAMDENPFKDENRAMIEQYRPISLLCSVSKVLEKLIFDEPYEIVKTKLEESQHGFRRHRSVVTQMLLFLDLLFNEFDEKDNEIFVL